MLWVRTRVTWPPIEGATAWGAGRVAWAEVAPGLASESLGVGARRGCPPPPPSPRALEPATACHRQHKESASHGTGLLPPLVALQTARTALSSSKDLELSSGVSSAWFHVCRRIHRGPPRARHQARCFDCVLPAAKPTLWPGVRPPGAGWRVRTKSWKTRALAPRVCPGQCISSLSPLLSCKIRGWIVGTFGAKSGQVLDPSVDSLPFASPPVVWVGSCQTETRASSGLAWRQRF